MAKQESNPGQIDPAMEPRPRGLRTTSASIRRFQMMFPRVGRSGNAYDGCPSDSRKPVSFGEDAEYLGEIVIVDGQVVFRGPNAVPAESPEEVPQETPQE